MLENIIPFFVNTRLNQELFDSPSSPSSFSVFVVFFYIKILYVMLSVYVTLHRMNLNV